MKGKYLPTSNNEPRTDASPMSKSGRGGLYSQSVDDVAK